MTQSNKIVQEVGFLEVIRSVSRKNKKVQAILLQEIEKHISRDSEEFEVLRKFVLDEVNSYTRSLLREIFGDVEFLMK